MNMKGQMYSRMGPNLRFVQIPPRAFRAGHFDAVSLGPIFWRRSVTAETSDPGLIQPETRKLVDSVDMCRMWKHTSSHVPQQ